MKGNNTCIKQKLIAATMMLVMTSGCFKRCGVFAEEGYDAREAMSSTVKIYTKITGHRTNLASVLGIEASMPEGTKEKSESKSWTGSGVVVRNNFDKKESLILSVAHVTHPQKTTLEVDESGFYFFKIDTIEMTVERLDGEKCAAFPMAGNEKQDLSVIKSSCIAGQAAELADKLPPVGASVMISGAALGFHPKGIFVVTDGRYMGIEEESGEEIITLPSAPGHSGSGIFYKGKVIGLLSKRTVHYEHISICVSLENAKTLLALAEGLWQLENV
jgi:S1-C subfamily serine protease